ncbi:MAG: 16S rRNA (uracil(1498)-N(3))-methyltransferase [Acidimicrobiales bacterium]|nr:16S rRNA (uracil(1498)-N(3))-methyltransferase [Acidimicrobiales bacterium]
MPLNRFRGPHVFVGDLEHPELDGGDLHHLSRVRRLRVGDVLTAGDGEGAWRVCRFTGRASLDPVGPVAHETRPQPSLVIGFALVKGSKPDLVVQKLTEIGIDVIMPFVADHSVVRWDDVKSDRNVQRWRLVARQAAMQSKRAWLPSVMPVEPFADAVAHSTVSTRSSGDWEPVEALPGPNDIRRARADLGGPPLPVTVHVLFIGPEGGWSERERQLLPDAASLGPHVLRAETAAIVAGALLVAHHRTG